MTSVRFQPSGDKAREASRAMERMAMRSSGIRSMVIAALALCVAVPAHAQVSEARIQELIKQAADSIGSGGSVPGDQAAQTRAPGQTRPVVRLTLDDAVKFALDRNLDIAVQRLNPEINDIAIASIRTVYHPSLTSTFSGRRRRRRQLDAVGDQHSSARRSSPGRRRSTAASRRACRGAAGRSPWR